MQAFGVAGDGRRDAAQAAAEPGRGLADALAEVLREARHQGATAA